MTEEELKALLLVEGFELHVYPTATDPDALWMVDFNDMHGRRKIPANSTNNTREEAVQQAVGYYKLGPLR